MNDCLILFGSITRSATLVNQTYVKCIKDDDAATDCFSQSNSNDYTCSSAITEYPYSELSFVGRSTPA